MKIVNKMWGSISHLFLLAGCSVLLLSARDAAARQSPPPPAPFPDVTYPNAADPRLATVQLTNQTSPPFYPSPWLSGAADWNDAYQKARAFVAQLTLLEKANLTTGTGWQQERCVGQTGAIPRLGFRSLCLQDSPMGVRFSM
ncbi:MAG: hypothetical protein M1823_004640 [Watsoniomyces obsoletus]|nr:MAG: hypothetical protein M1823_004640 [Watsoniomyces obsoletus]